MNLLHELIDGSASCRPDQTALLKASDELSYAELERATTAVASGLERIGLERRDRVAIYLPKQFEAIVAMFAASRASGMFVPINPVLKAAQVGHILRDSGTRVLVTSQERATAIAAELETCRELDAVVIVGETSGEKLAAARSVAWSELLDVEPVGRKQTIDTDPVAIFYTSGSTGRAKGVVLSHRNMVAGAESVASYLGNRHTDRLLAVLPLSFDYGFSQLSTAFLSGARVALLDYLLPRDVIKQVERHGITGLAAVPPLWIQLAELDWPPAAVAQLRYITNSGGAMPTATLSKLRARLPSTSVYLMYGLTEAFRSTYLPPDQIDARPTSMGKAIPNAEVLVVRPDGTECGPDEPGELVHRGALVSLGYWRDPERTAARFRATPGALDEVSIGEISVWSGDTVKKDHDGYLYFVGRRDDMIKTSGYRVSPTEIEEVVYGAGISEAAAVGAPHPTLGQAIVVFAVADEQTPEAAEQLRNDCRAELPAFMVPAHIEWCDRPLPRSANGKIDRRALADRCADLFEEGRA